MDTQSNLGAPSSSCAPRKRKRSVKFDDDKGGEEEPKGALSEQLIENEYEAFDDDDEYELDDKYNLKPREFVKLIASQEPTTIEHYDDIKVTPFNLVEELEEGEIDKTGCYIFKKQTDEEKDSWADSVDWTAVRQAEIKQKQMKQSLSTEQTIELGEKNDAREESGEIVDKLKFYKQMLRIMNPEESVKKTIKRLGDSIPKRGKPNKNKNSSCEKLLIDQNDIKEARRRLDVMIDSAHQCLEAGEMDVYEKSYEDLEDAIN